jgi:peptide/nickel transport system substrate-binding protein
MTKKIVWLVVSGLMALSLVMAACGPAVVEEREKEKVIVVEEVEKKAVEEKEEVVEEEVVEDTGPKYGGIINTLRTSDIRNWDDYYGNHLTPACDLVMSRLAIGDWTRGPAGSGELGFVRGDVLFETKMGQLVESWEFFSDARGVFKLRQGIYYGLDTSKEASRLVGGREWTADDAAFALNRLKNTKGTYINRADPVMVEGTTITALDKYTLEIDTVPERAYEAQYWLNFYAYSDTPREVIEKYGITDDWKRVVGTGPFFITDYTPGSMVTFEKNPNYFAKDPVGPGKGNQLPYVDGVRMMIIPDVSTRLAALRTGKLDYISGLAFEDAEFTLQTAPELQSVRFMAGGGGGIAMRTDKEELPYSDIRVRQALMLATDFDAINQAFSAGLANLPTWPISHQSGYEHLRVPMEDLPQRVQELYQYNPERAKELLAEAGYPEGFKASLVLNAGSVDKAAVYKDMWQKVGVEITFDVKESGVKRSMDISRSHEEMTWGGGANNTRYAPRLGQVDGDTSGNLSLIDEDYIHETRAAYAKAWLVGDYEEMGRLSREMLKQVLWEAWVIPEPDWPQYHLWWPWLKNFDGAVAPGIFNGPGFQFYWLDEDLKKEMGY